MTLENEMRPDMAPKQQQDQQQKLLQLMEMVQSPTMRYGMEMEALMIPGRPAEVITDADVFPGTEYSRLTVADYVALVFQAMIRNQENTQVVLLLGSPGQGKSIIGKQLMGILNGLWNMYSHGAGSIVNDDIAWGDGFPLPPKYAVPDTVDYRSDPTGEWRARKQLEADMASQRIERTLLAVMQEHQLLRARGEARTHLVVGDLPPTSGDVVRLINPTTGASEESIAGILRGRKLLQNIVQHTGRFAEQRYDVHVAAVVASPEVEAAARRDRELLARAHTPQEMRRVLAMRKKDPGGSVSDQALTEYVQEVALPDAMDRFEEDVVEVLKVHDMYAALNEITYGVPMSEELFRNNKQVRQRLMGGFLLPRLLKGIGASPERSVILWNQHVQDTVTMYLGLKRRKPVLDLFPRGVR